ncbi:RelA/SpoT domain-containing protein [Hyalangium versicolor]|uniref:RelA/SpoT domain-containing protein n=1 Tax=Hyalangium versicolor TaxID=2861190 RepID=UPI001CCD82C6|nr:RelA/SpoT domain-containing protein [Hyalangium versicolor]
MSNSDTEIDRAIQQLVDAHFPWGDGPCPERVEDRLAHVRRWLEQQAAIYRGIATALIARVEPILTQLQQRLSANQPDRLFFRIDESHITKSPESILEKMAREWRREQTLAPPVSFHNLDQLKDLGRFRIVANFLDDVEVITRCIEEPYDATKRTRITPGQFQLREEFGLASNRFEDMIAMAPEHRSTGERCRKGWFSPRQADLRGYRVEVQIVTLLQEAWDKKEHFLVYERVRRGEHVPLEHRIIFADLSAQLAQADRDFNRLKREAEAQPDGELEHAAP